MTNSPLENWIKILDKNCHATEDLNRIFFLRKKREVNMVYNLGHKLGCLRGTVLLQFEDMNCLGIAGGTQELGICTEGQWTDADVSKTEITDGQRWNCCGKYDAIWYDASDTKRCSDCRTNLFIPLRNSNSFCPSGTLKTLITVPWWEKCCKGIMITQRLVFFNY